MNPRRPHALTVQTFDAPIAVRSREQGLRCPKCKAHLETVSIGALEVEHCTGCQGLWFDVLEWEDARELEVAARLDRGDPSVGSNHDTDTGLLCPKCGNVPLTRLEVAHHPGLHIDKCPRCYGAFFDAGEFSEYRKLNFVERLRKFWHLR
jgi:Zn-finger nucleic acid-binding protein